jgi:hypothetical protein
VEIFREDRRVRYVERVSQRSGNPEAFDIVVLWLAIKTRALFAEKRDAAPLGGPEPASAATPHPKLLAWPQKPLILLFQNRHSSATANLSPHWERLQGSELWGQMPHYFFTVRATEGDATERAAELSDDAAALAFACEIVRELAQSLAHTDRTSLVGVRDETRPMVLSIPFLAACA